MRLTAEEKAYRLCDAVDALYNQMKEESEQGESAEHREARAQVAIAADALRGAGHDLYRESKRSK